MNKNSRDLVEFISKENIRNLQRKRESGLTLYALLFIFSFLLFKILDYYPKVAAEGLTGEMFLIAGITFNTVTSVLIVLMGYFYIIDKPTGVKIFLEKNNKVGWVFIPLVIFFVGSLSVINFYNYWNIAEINKWYWLMFFIYYLVQLVSPLFIVLGLRFRYPKLKTKKRIPNFTFFNEKTRRIAGVTSSILGYLFLIFSIYLIASFQLEITFNLSIEYVKFSLIIYGCFICIVQILILLEESTKNTKLEELERQVYLYNLTDDEIMERLENQYFGIGLHKFIDRKEMTIGKELNKVKIEFSNYQNRLNEIENIDFSIYLREVKERLKEIDDEATILFKTFEEAYEEMIKELLDLKLMSSLTNDEGKYLAEFGKRINLKRKELFLDIEPIRTYYFELLERSKKG